MVILVLILVGMTMGYALRRIAILKKVNSSISITICAMLFLLGMTVGGDSQLLGNLGVYGGQALLICVAGLVGSILFTMGVNKILYKKKQDEEGRGNE